MIEARPGSDPRGIGWLAALVLACVACGIRPLAAQPGPAAFNAQRCVECALRGQPDKAALPLAFAEFTEDCEDGVAAACTLLGVMYERGFATAPDPVYAAQLHHRACVAENAGGCVNLGSAYARGVGVTQDLGRAAALFEWGCRRGHARGCAELADLHLVGQGVVRNPSRAAELYQRACDEGDGEGCFALAAQLEYGVSLPADTVRAISLYELACLRGTPEGCDGMSRMYAESERLNRERRKVRPHPRLAGCAAGVAPDCAAVAMAYLSGDGVPKDVGKAVGLLQRACRAGYAPSCTVIAPMLHGACVRGNAESCAALAKLAGPAPPTPP